MVTHPPTVQHITPTCAFSLAEVVLALGITTFCLVALMGLFTVGLRTEKESAETLQVSHLAQGILANRRSAPTANLGSSFPLPVLQVGNSVPKTTVKLKQDGTVTSSAEDSRYALSYRVDAPAAGTGKNFVVYMNFHWPAQATAANAEGHYELLATLPAP